MEDLAAQEHVPATSRCTAEANAYVTDVSVHFRGNVMFAYVFSPIFKGKNSILMTSVMNIEYNIK